VSYIEEVIVFLFFLQWLYSGSARPHISRQMLSASQLPTLQRRKSSQSSNLGNGNNRNVKKRTTMNKKESSSAPITFARKSSYR